MKAIKVEKTVSRGIVIGKAYLVEKPILKDTFGILEEVDIPKEIIRYENAVKHAQTDLVELAKTNNVFEAHLEMVKDITLYEGVVTKIKEEKLSAEGALDVTAAEFIQIFECMDDEYMRERAADIKDIRHRLMCELQGVKVNIFDGIKEQVILIAEDLTPSDTASLDLSKILGFITQDGGVTSHVSIMAKGLGIPALVGVTDILNQVKHDDMIIMDAGAGNIILNPEKETIVRYEKLQEELRVKQEELAKIDDLPTVTQDGKSVHLCVNVGSVQDIKKALEYNMDGVGLFRSEFLYMDNNHFPTEEEQYQVYKESVQLCGKELTVRTLDIGGDKELSYYEFEKEENPFLGWRAIRISLELVDMFKTQLRAILRASAFGTIRIMFPMIISMEELLDAKAILKECMEELNNQNLAFDEKIHVGMMIETPASVLLVEDFAKEVDFFSIGTNDLTQYLLAVDRGNKKISKLYNSFHPSVIRSIQRIINAAHNNHIKVGMCGEFASDEKAAQLLLGLGLDEFSMSASELLNTKYILRNSSYENAKVLAQKACEMLTIQDVYKVLGINE